MNEDQVVVALSGGVDSAVAAALLVEQGKSVVGITMRLYDASGSKASSGGRCCGPKDIEDARRVCEHLGIPHYVLDLSEPFMESVMDDFAGAYLAGETPNPCARCNQYIKFTPLLKHAQALGINTIVTGHYAKLVDGPDGRQLHRGEDGSKDQSYFLFAMPWESMPNVEFPLGHYTKDQVRAMAEKFDLPNATKKDSQEVCFVPDGDYTGFVAKHALKRGKSLPVAGSFVDTSGQVLGSHGGVHNFTVGQRKGLGNVTGSEVRYVVDINPDSAEVVIGDKAAAQKITALVRDVTWLGDASPQSVKASVQVRYRAKPVASEIEFLSDGTAKISFEAPTIAAPGQAAVFYQGDRVLGGGWISRESKN